ncbi:MAG: histone deacetylase [Desulfobulbaceae bacterium]|jgi:acetoin utilization deacetylase AcuC-like enzyme|nr:histone deacetylase [Desulfobulbaceae bacterium]
MRRTGFLYDPRFLLHETGEDHPECPDRLRVIIAAMEQSGLMEQLVPIKAEKAKQRWIEAVHHIRYMLRFEETCAFGMPSLDHDENRICYDTYDVAILAVGGILKAVDAVMAGEVDNAFCAVRPPGHHAESDRAMGFCYLNNVAIAARYLQENWKIQRIGIIDFDVHHGNGTQHIFEQDPTVFYYSIHEHPSFAYPGTGRDFDIGIGEGEGFTKNSPVLPGRGDEEYRKRLTEELLPAMSAFQPQFLLLSAGFDAHRQDLMSGVNLSTEGYDYVSRLLIDLGAQLCGGRLVSILEGGYQLDILPLLVTNHIKYLAGLR